MLKTQFSVGAHWDPNARIWLSSCDEAALATEAPTFDELLDNVIALANDIIAQDASFKPGDTAEILMQAKRSEALVRPEGADGAFSLRRVVTHLARTPLWSKSRDAASLLISPSRRVWP